MIVSKIQISQLVLLLTYCCLMGCSVVQHKPQLPKLPISESETNNIIDKLVDPKDTAKYLKGLYKVTTHVGQSKDSFRQAVIVRPPDRFRMESLPENGFYTLSLLVIDQGQASFFDRQSNKRIETDAIDALIEKELGLRVPARFLPYFFLAQIPKVFWSEYKWSAYQLDEHTVVIIDLAKTIYWYVDRKDWQLKQVQFWDQFNERLNLQITYSKYKAEQDLVIPSEFDLTVPEHDFKMQFILSQGHLADTVTDNLFRVSQVQPKLER